MQNNNQLNQPKINIYINPLDEQEMDVQQGILKLFTLLN